MSTGFKYNALFLDEDKQYRMNYLASKSWKLINLLPIKITVTKTIKGKSVTVVTIDPFKTTEVSSNSLIEGDIVTVLFESKDARYYRLMDPITLIGDSRTIKIGDVVYKESTNTLVQRSHSDIMGLRIYNHLPLNVEVYWTPSNKKFTSLRTGGDQTTLLAKVGGSDGISYMSGDINSTYIMNDRFGFNIGDVLSFVFDVQTPGLKGQKGVIKATINDNYMTDIHIGMITQSFNPAIRDMFSYRIDGPNVLGSPYIADKLSVFFPMNGPSTPPGGMDYISY